MNDNILLDEIKKTEERNLIYQNVRAKIKAIESLISELEKQKQTIMNSLEFQKKQYEMAFHKNQERIISTAEFSKIDQEHRHKMDKLNLRKISLEKAIESKKNLVKRLWCLEWILIIPYDKNFIEILKKTTGQKFKINKKDAYNKFLENIVIAEKSRLVNEQSALRLKFDFNNIPNYPVHPEHEFYSPNNLTSEQLQNIQNKIIEIRKYEEQKNYSEFIEYHRLTLGNFMNENSEQLFEQLFTGDEKRNII